MTEKIFEWGLILSVVIGIILTIVLIIVGIFAMSEQYKNSDNPEWYCKNISEKNLTYNRKLECDKLYNNKEI